VAAEERRKFYQVGIPALVQRYERVVSKDQEYTEK
jgi:hypothetical protein